VGARDGPRGTPLLETGERAMQRDGDVWETTVAGAGPGTRYAYAVDPERPLIDPCAVRVERGERLPCVVTAPPEPVAWRRPGHATVDSILYEMHVRGFTRHPSSGVRAPGTFSGVVERAGHLVDLGVTTVELMPVHEFDEREGRGNYWGYSPIAWFAPNRRYAENDPVAEFRAMVRALHELGIEVILDVVFNHTAEQGADGPVLHWKELEKNHAYEARDRSGCGNSIDTRDPWMRRTIVDCLRWWHNGLGADGFRFDLATILSDGLVRMIENDEALRGARLIAEPWDAAGGHRVADWPGNERWSVWNDRYRDEVRRCWLEPDHGGGALASRLLGSSDMFDEGPARTVNFVTAHDGYTLRDVVSYEDKHNWENGEANRDGRDGEPSANHGVEGPTHSRSIRAAREKSRRNLVATLLLSQGCPMLLSGDESGRTQGGNNNPYCHDTAEFWLAWDEPDENFGRFLRGLIALRKGTRLLRRRRFVEEHEIDWFGPDRGPPDWDDRPGRFAYRLKGERDLVVAVNLDDSPCGFDLPADAAWELLADTAGVPPEDWHDPPAELPGPHLLLAEQSLAVLRMRPSSSV